MRGLKRAITLTFFVFVGLPNLAQANTQCADSKMTSPILNKKMHELADSFLQIKKMDEKKEKARSLLDLVNCEFDRTANLPLDHEYRWSLSDAHALLSDLVTVNTQSAKECQLLEKKMVINESDQGTFSDEPLQTKNLELAKKLAKNFCQPSK